MDHSEATAIIHTLAARPRPPRTRSNKLASSQTSNSTHNHGNNKISPTDGALHALENFTTMAVNVNTSRLALIGALETLTPPATPPMGTPAMMSLDGAILSQQEDHSGKLVPDNVDSKHVKHGLGHVQRENQLTESRSAQELAAMLEEARQIIHERERELGLAASIGKSLLDSNIALRAKQDALLQRVQQQQQPFSPPKTGSGSASTSPSNSKGKQRSSGTYPPPTMIPFPGLQIPSRSYGAKGEYIEGLPPPSPRQSVAGRRKSQGSIGSKDDLLNMFAHSRDTSAGSSSSARSIASPQRTSTRNVHVDSPLRQSTSTSTSHHRRISSGSSANFGHHTNRMRSSSSSININNTSISRSSSTKSISEIYNATLVHQHQQLQLDIQKLRLSEQNEELESKLQDLEIELNKVDISGKKKLKKLDKELENLKLELELAWERNKELEDRLGSKKRLVDKKNGKNSKNLMILQDDEASSIDTVPMLRVRSESERSDSCPCQHDTSLGQQCATSPVSTYIRPNCDTDEPCGESTVDADSAPANDPSNLPASDSIVAQLLAKINELQETNETVTAQREALDERLAQASTHYNDMKQKYEFLEERVIEAEIRNHRILELEGADEDAVFLDEQGMLAIEWRQGDLDTPVEERDSISPATKLKRKAVGNRPRIEHYRRLSSLYGSLPQSEGIIDPVMADLAASPPQKGTYCPSNSRTATPRSDTSRTSLKTRSRAGSFYEAEAEESDNILSFTQRRVEDEEEAFAHDQEARMQDVWSRRRPDYCPVPAVTPARTSTIPMRDHFEQVSPIRDLEDIIRNHHSLASEIGSQWNTSVEQFSPDRPVRATEALLTSPHSAQLLQQGASSAFTPPAGQSLIRRSSTKVTLFESRSDSEDSEDDLGNFLPGGAPDANAYDSLQATLQDLAVRWEDDYHPAAGPSRPRVQMSAGTARHNRSASLGWTYEDGESDNSDNDPWKEENSSQHALESRGEVEAREKAESRIMRRRLRLQQLAKEMLEEDTEDQIDDGMSVLAKLALVRVDSNGSDENRKSTQHVNTASSDASADYENVVTTSGVDGRGTDYWPVSYRARYSPSVVAMRVQKRSKDYINMCLLWTRFLAVLAVAVVFSIWRGPENVLGVRSRRRVGPSEASEGPGSVILRRRTKGGETDQ